MIRVLALSLYGPQAASHRVRLSQFQPGLAECGIHLDIHSLLDDEYLLRRFTGRRVALIPLVYAYLQRIHTLKSLHSYDLAIVYCELFPFLPGWFERLFLRVPFIYDCDDAFYLKYSDHRLRWLKPLLGSKTNYLMQEAAAVTVGNAHLSSYSKKFNSNVTIIPSSVDTDRLRPVSVPPRHHHDQAFTVGWIGSPSTSPYLQQLVLPLKQLALEHPVRLIVVGGAAPSICGVEVIERPWSLEDEPYIICQFDVGVMPLPDTPWVLGKCAYKLIQYMACAVPVIASNVGANVQAVPPACGFLASSPNQWLCAFRKLIADPELRLRMGASGRQWVERRYSLRSALPGFASVIRHAAANLQ